MVVLSLWHDDVCTGSVRLELAEATRLAVFLTAHLGDRAVERERGDESFSDTQIIPLPAPPGNRT